MKTITKDNFEEEVLKSELPVLVRLSVDEGCKFCDNYKPIFEAFAEKHPEIKCVTMSKPTLRSQPDALMVKYNPKDSYPTTLSFEKGELLRTQGGVQNEEQLLSMLETLQNIPDERLNSIKYDVQVDIANQERDLFKTRLYLFNIEKEINARKIKILNQNNG